MDLDELPKEACPADLGVARLMINPGYIARSFFPARMLHSAELESVGSRTVKVTSGWVVVSYTIIHVMKCT